MIYLLGCDHYLQEYDRTESVDELWAAEFKTKERFFELVKDVIEIGTNSVRRGGV